jgi:ComF family protein
LPRNSRARRVDGVFVARALSVVSAGVAALIAAIGDALSPPSCAACDAMLARRSIFCVACARTIEPAHPGGPAFAAASFGGAVAVAIKRLKYAGRADVARPLAELLRTRASAIDATFDVVVPVPLHPKRLAERGFNQAALLAAPIARDRSVPFAPRALARARHTPQQASLARTARLANVKDAFVARDEAMICDRRVLLVDDVATTGATLRACADALRAAGARAVNALVVARSDGDGG